ncbi:MAG: HAMP domain-containing histidine kinase, partial [Chloroflexi bacterium]|nr:HAMP domain-containing histidine kinase [Chloroflexota bacterium]
YVANTPRWRHPLIGYLVSVPIVILCAYSIMYLRDFFAKNFLFPDSVMVLPILLVALFWGVGPALFTLLLSTLALDYEVVPPLGQLNLDSWLNTAQFLPFIISGLAIAIIIAQRERARLNALAAEQELQSYAEHLEEINRKLEDASQMKDRFISIASHELKTPITTIRGQAQLVLRRFQKQQEQSSETEYARGALEKINEQTGRLTSLIDDLLDVSSIRAGKIELRKRKYDLRDICREVVEDQRLLTGRSITLDMPSDPVKVDADRDRLSQVIVNLISNAVKYSPENRPVEVVVSGQDRVASLRVRDYGKGIAQDQIERIFETFYRTPEAEASSKRGLGLGLAISKDIVERHGGSIWCESEPKKGSTFCVGLPMR